MSEPTDSKPRLIDEILGRFDEKSAHPYLGIAAPGGQYPEGRAFARSANVYALARLTEVLIGLHDFVLHGGDAADASLSKNLSLDKRHEHAKAIAQTINCLKELCPSMVSTEPVELESDWGLPPYVADERLPSIIESINERYR